MHYDWIEYLCWDFEGSVRNTSFPFQGHASHPSLPHSEKRSVRHSAARTFFFMPPLRQQLQQDTKHVPVVRWYVSPYIQSILISQEQLEAISSTVTRPPELNDDNMLWVKAHCDLIKHICSHNKILNNEYTYYSRITFWTDTDVNCNMTVLFPFSQDKHGKSRMFYLV